MNLAAYCQKSYISSLYFSYAVWGLGREQVRNHVGGNRAISAQ